MSDAAPRESPRGAQLYVAAVSLVGTAVAVYCATVLVHHGVPGQWLLFAALTFACGRFTLVVPGVDARFSVSEMVGLSCVLLFGPEAGAITLAVDSLIVSFVRRMKPGKVAFNCGNLALSVWLSGTFFFAAAGTGPLFGQSTSSAGLVVPLGLMAATYFLVNSGLIAIAIALTAGSARSPSGDRISCGWDRGTPPAPASPCCSSSPTARWISARSPCCRPSCSCPS